MVGRYKPLSTILAQEPYRFDFFQAVRILERWQADRRAVGGDGLPSQECVRFQAHLSLDFPPSALYQVDIPQDSSQPPKMVVTFFGLTGPTGALPRCYTEILLERQRSKDTTLREFLDLFNHRLISLFYRAWHRNRFYLGYERAERQYRQLRSEPARQRAFLAQGRAQIDRFSQYLLELSGLGFPALRLRDSVRSHVEPRYQFSDSTVRYYAGLFALQRRSSAGLEGLLGDYFRVPMAVESCVMQWLFIPREDQTSLQLGRRNQLGQTAVVGERVRDRQSRIRMRLGPLAYVDFVRFLPSGDAFRVLGDLARLYVRQQYDLESQLVLRANEVPELQLSSRPQGAPAMLGWNTWLRAAPMTVDRADTLLQVK